MQCTSDCGAAIFPGEQVRVEIDPETMRAATPLPECPRCGALARPNILMFGDYEWISVRTDAQRRRMRDWLGALEGAKLAIVECGAGQAVPTVRMMCEDIARKFGGTLIRINTRESEVPAGHIALPLGALEAIEAIDARLGRVGELI
jgi:NAD-dependent SIR2 family protein deacetylase